VLGLVAAPLMLIAAEDVPVVLKKGKNVHFKATLMTSNVVKATVLVLTQKAVILVGNAKCFISVAV
jgi:hypothetical protein